MYNIVVTIIMIQFIIYNIDIEYVYDARKMGKKLTLNYSGIIEGAIGWS